MTDITPSPAQASAIKQITAWYKGGTRTPQVFYLAGFAGTGKSTIYKAAIQELVSAGVNHHVTCAFTGKAANVLRRKGNGSAMTCHSALYTPEEDEETGEFEFTLNPTGECAMSDLIGIDEGSMIGEDMGKDFLSFGKKILVMGDPGQLPPVNGQGFFTRRQPDVFLTEIHRQAADNPILRLATMAREGEMPPLGDFGAAKVLPLNKENQPLIYREDTQPICGTHRVRFTYTQRIRKLRGIEGPFPLMGERIMCMRNDRAKGLFNGGQGTMITDARVDKVDGNYIINVQMDDLEKPLRRVKTHQYHFMQHFAQYERPIIRGMNEFDWGYLLTCHKAQGSEWPHVTVIDDSAAFREDRWKWLYTALTRPSDELLLLRRMA